MANERTIQADIFGLRGAPRGMLDVLHSMHVSSPDVWIPRRLVLANWWLFDEPQEIYFGRGNLMLTGKNEAGKSTVLITIVTLVLDRMISPERIDTTGGRDKVVRYYLVGKDDADANHPFHHEDRTGYIGLEFERGRSGRYRTIGIGLRTSRSWPNREVVPWSFVLNEGCRLERDIYLIDPALGRPLTKAELKTRVGDRGRVFDKDQQSQYQQAVNGLLFGFPSMDDFHRYMDVLHVLRTPKLGDDLNPERVERLLVDSLPPVDTAPVDQAAELFRKMDTIEAEIRRLQKQRDQAQDLEVVQVEAIEAEARLLANLYVQALDVLRSKEKALGKVENELDNARHQQLAASTQLQFLADELATIEGPLSEVQEQIRDHGSYDTERRLNGRRAERADVRKQIGQLEDDRDRENQEAKSAEHARAREGEIWTQTVEEYQSLLADVAATARTALWMDFSQRAESALIDSARLRLEDDVAIGQALGIGTIAGECQLRREAVRPVIEAHSRVAEARAAYEEAVQNTKRKRSEYTAADNDLASIERDLDKAQTAAGDFLIGWTDQFDLFEVDGAAVVDATDRILAYDDPAQPVSWIMEPLRRFFDDASEETAERRRSADVRLSEAQRALETVNAEIQGLEAEEDVFPGRAAEVERARQVLLEAGIPAVPLYEAVAFTEASGTEAEQARIEEALEAAGLLDALIVPEHAIERTDALLGAAGLGDRWLRPAANGPRNPWLHAVASPVVEEEHIAAALAGIGCNEEALLAHTMNAVTRKGRWRTGTVEGVAPCGGGQARFIGEANRRAERDRRLADARERRDELATFVIELENELHDVRARLTSIAQAWESLRDAIELRKVNEVVVRREGEKKRVDTLRRHLELLASDEGKKQGVYRQTEATLEQACAHAPYLRGRSAEAVHGVHDALLALTRFETQLTGLRQRLTDGRARFGEAAARVERAEQRIAELGERVRNWEHKDNTVQAAIEHLEEQLALESVGLEVLLERQRVMVSSKDQNEKARSKEQRKHDETATTIKIYTPQLDERRRDRDSARVEKEAAESRLSTVLSCYPTTQGMADDARVVGLSEFALNLIGQVERSQIAVLAQEAQNALLNTYHRVKDAFAGMNPRVQDRLVLFSHPDGELRVADLQLRLDEELARKERALEDEDQHIIENVFLRSMAEAIRKAIARTRDWVLRVNAILEEMDLFKGGTMQLRWRVRQRRTEDAYDPKDLDSLFTRTGISLPEERQQHLIQIFRDMIGEVRRRARDNALAIDYHAELMALVNYKQWYSLEIERKDETGKYRRLTRKVYGTGSMGRRSLDLILPLIAAVHARLSVAAPDAPRLVGFDEAFAGVDDQNAAQIYVLLSRVGLSWVMATEKATNYGTHLPGVVTYEFLNDGHAVAPTAVIWDGILQHSFEEEELGYDAATPRHAMPGELSE